MHDCGKVEGQVTKLQEERDAALFQVKAEHSESLQHHHAWMCEMELRKDREKKLEAANHEVDELRKQLRYVSMIAQRLGPKASEVHREEAVALLDGTLRDAEDAWKKTCDHRWAIDDPSSVHSTRIRCRDCGLKKG